MIVRTNIIKIFGISGIMIFPFCIVKKDANQNTIRHERIHFKQALNLLVIPFYVLYFLEWIRCLIQYGKDAYYWNCFEQEAYLNSYKKYYKVGYNWLYYIKNKTNLRE